MIKILTFAIVTEQERIKYDRVFEKELLPHINAQILHFTWTLNEDDADDLVRRISKPIALLTSMMRELMPKHGCLKS